MRVVGEASWAMNADLKMSRRVLMKLFIKRKNNCLSGPRQMILMLVEAMNAELEISRRGLQVFIKRKNHFLTGPREMILLM